MSYSPFLNSIIPLPRLRATSGRRLPKSRSAMTNKSIISHELTTNMAEPHSSRVGRCMFTDAGRLCPGSLSNSLNEPFGKGRRSRLALLLGRRAFVFDSLDALFELGNALTKGAGQGGDARSSEKHQNDQRKQ